MVRLLLFLPAVCWLPNSVGDDELTFERDVRPIFRAHCFDCHGATDKLEGGLDLRLVRFMKKGGESGTALEPGNPEESFFLQRIISGEMPPGSHNVPPEQIDILKRWVAAGAKTARPEPEEIGPGLGISEEERAYWFFQPVKRPDVPDVAAKEQVRSPIDAFLLHDLEAAELSFSPIANKATLARRAYLNLTGLPPTPEQLLAFENDEAPDAWRKLIDQLLASSRYGERWGRHWLDVAGYADSEGNLNRDDVRPWAYKYRDWVIRAFNEGMPFDQFITWQLAGDELVEQPYRNLSAENIDKLTATGFLRMAMDSTQHANNEENRNKVMTDTMSIVTSSLLGMSVACAQCHDHRYDPISQEDYYRLRSIFEPALNWQKWKQPTARRVSLYTDEDIAKAAEIEKEAAAKTAERTAKQKQYMDEALAKELSRHDEALRKPLEDAYRTAAAKRSAEQKALLAKFPSVASLSTGVLYQYNPGHADELKKISKEIEAIRAKKPPHEYLRALTEQQADAVAAKLFYRGDYRQPQHEVPPGVLSVVSSTVSGDVAAIADNDEDRPTTGRRLAWAKWLTSGKHPMVARVLVNRFWLHHFGKTFVSTPDEFGKLGRLPSHPKLLDWLADEFVSSGWDLRHLHRLIMTSTVYMQASERTAEGNARDSSNQLYWHFPVQRLDAEALRDSMLAVSGRLDTKQFGPAVGVAADDTGQVIVKGDKQRRSIYLQVRRTQPLAMLSTFDAPVMKINCTKRDSSTAATQSLMMMNSDFVLNSSQALADRISREADSHSQTLPEELIASLESQIKDLQETWQFGYGFIGGGAGPVDAVPNVRFHPYPFFGANTWKGGEKVPDATLGYSFLNAAGGHPQSDTTKPIRRWISPVSGTLKISGSLSRPATNSDGVHLTLFSSRLGVQTEVTVPTGSKNYSASFEVQRGDIIDTIIGQRTANTSDSFSNTFTIELLENGKAIRTWKSQEGFHGPVKPATSPLRQLAFGWQLAFGRPATIEELKVAADFLSEQLQLLQEKDVASPFHQAMTNYCQALLTSNSFLYVE